VPGVLGKAESLEDVKGSYPVYTRPEIWEKHKVPEALMSGNHKEIEKWRNL
jgi:tRNA (guanine37-N1)-methyltransferase